MESKGEPPSATHKIHLLVSHKVRAILKHRVEAAVLAFLQQLLDHVAHLCRVRLIYHGQPHSVAEAGVVGLPAGEEDPGKTYVELCLAHSVELDRRAE